VWRAERFSDNNEAATALAVCVGMLAMVARGLLP
jgi:hypothetical protein